ncbi:hypothetical protein K445DRAFT_115682 [Daldinia sp. EC12]|nr:hypothetical protein K445DRAFT_115682 [Daldinia sp. EC12]
MNCDSTYCLGVLTCGNNYGNSWLTKVGLSFLNGIGDWSTRLMYIKGVGYIHVFNAFTLTAIIRASLLIIMYILFSI